MAAVAVVLGLAGCGEEQRAAPDPPPPPPAPIAYDGPLPGKRVDIGAEAGYVGVRRSSVRRLGLVPRNSAAPIALLVAVDRRDRSLCVGYRQQVETGFANLDFRCFGPGASNVIAYVARAGAEADRVDGVTVTGVVRKPVAAVEVVSGRAKSRLLLQTYPGAPFAAFTSVSFNPPFPRLLRALDARDVLVEELPLVAVAEPPCAEGCVGAAGPWVDVVDAGG